MRRQRPGSTPSVVLPSLLLLLLLFLSACGGDGGDGITPPSSDGVAAVSVTPPAASAEKDDTVRFTATVLDGDGNVLSGATVTWSTSSASVATVGSDGLATGVGAGQATLTATASGVSGTATLTVTEPAGPEVVATGSVGSGGGSVGNDDVGVTIPAGALGGTTTVEILAAEEADGTFGSDAVTGTYYLRGFPADRDVEVRVRLKVTGSLDGPSLVGMSVPVFASTDDSTGWRAGLLLREAEDSAGYLVATVPVRGNAASSLSAPGPARAEGVDDLLDGLLGGVTNTRTDTVPGGLWVIRSFGAPRAELTSKVSRIAKLLEDARLTLEGQGYGMAHRTQWPMDVQVHPIPDAYGMFAQKGPFPLNVNTGWFEFDLGSFAAPDMPGTAIHEFYHFMQARYTGSMQRAQYSSYSWLKEASSTWVEEKAPETLGVFRNSFFQGQRGDLFLGLYPSLTADQGYGKAPMIKYVADAQGTARVKGIWESVQAGNGAVDALLGAFTGTPESWWPDLLTRYMKGEIIALSADQLPPNMGAIPVKPGQQTWSWNNKLRPLAAQWLHFTPKPEDYGTGTTLTFRLPPGLAEAGFTYLPFRMSAGGTWEELGGAQDSVVISGSDLRLGREYGIYLVHTKPTAPYTQEWTNSFTTDLGYVEGDYVTSDASVTDDGIAYTRPEGDTVHIDVAGQSVSTFTSLSENGVWLRDAQNPNKYTWKATDAFQQTLTAYNATASSWAQVYSSGDSLYLTATVDLNPPASTTDGPGSAAAFGGMGLLLLTGLVVRRRRVPLTAALVGAVALGSWGCDLGSISFSARFVYEFRFGSPKLTASAADPTAALVELPDGSGTMKVERYRSEWWEYIRDDKDQVVDSVAHTRTAAGTASVTLSAAHYADGVITADDGEQLQGAARVLQLPQGTLMDLLERRRR